MKVEDRIESNHQSMTMWVDGGGCIKRGKRKEARKWKGRRGIWTEDGRKSFVEHFGKEEEWEGVEEG